MGQNNHTNRKATGKDTGIDALDTRPIWDGGRVFGIETPTILMNALGNPQDQVPAIHITGTNGKGSTCAFTAAILHYAGHSVGQFTSPHLSHVTERCVIDGRATSENTFREAVNKAAYAAENNNINPSFFELVCAASFIEFARRELDYMVIEVGLGGRLDATNTIKCAHATVITNVRFDHVDILGHSLSQIAHEKAGILRPNVPVVLGQMEKEPLEVIKIKAKEFKSPLYSLGHEFGLTSDGIFFTDFGKTRHGHFKHIPLLGSHQIENAAVAARVALLLNIRWDTICEGINMARWPGRLEYIKGKDSQSPDFLLDVAHNVDGINAVMSFLKEHFQNNHYTKLIFVCSILRRKDWRAMVSVLDTARSLLKEQHHIMSNVIWTKSDHKSATSPNELNEASILGGITIEDTELAINEASKLANKDGLVVVIGSCYLVGVVRPLLLGEEFRTIQKSP